MIRNDLAAWALAQLIAGLPLPPDLSADLFIGNYADAYAVYLNSNGDGPLQLQSFIATRAGLRDQVFAFRPGSPRPPAAPPRARPMPQPAEVLAWVRERMAGEEEAHNKLRACFNALAALDLAGEAVIRDAAIQALGVSAGDYRRLIAAARNHRPPDAGAPQIHEEVLWVGQPRELRQLFDYVEGQALTVVQLYVQTTSIRPGRDGPEMESERKFTPYLITGMGERMKLDEASSKMNLRLRIGEPAFDGSRFSPEGVRAFLDGHRVAPLEVLAAVEAIFDRFVEFQPVRYVEKDGRSLTRPAMDTRRMLALDVMSTYFMPVWPALGYTLFVGEAGSGKTTAQRIQAMLGCMAEQITAGISVAALKRMTDMGYMLCFDDIENINDKNFDSDKKAIILAGNTRGVTIPMMMEIDGVYQLVRLNAFCKKSFTNISGIAEALGTRVILIPMMKAIDKSKTERDPLVAVWPMPRQQIIDDLYNLALARMSEVDAIYRALDAHPLADRERQIWAPIVSLAQLCGGETMRAQMVELAVAKRREKEDRQKPDFTLLVMRALLGLISDNPDLCVTIDNILDRVAWWAEIEKVKDGDGNAVWGKGLTVKVGGILRNLGVYTGEPKRPSSDKPRVYTLDPEQVRQRAIAFSLIQPEGGNATAD